MQKIPPVSRRKTITAWVSVGVFTIALIGISLFLQNSSLFKASADILDDVERLGGTATIGTKETGTSGTSSSNGNTGTNEAGTAEECNDFTAEVQDIATELEPGTQAYLEQIKTDPEKVREVLTEQGVDESKINEIVALSEQCSNSVKSCTDTLNSINSQTENYGLSISTDDPDSAIEQLESYKLGEYGLSELQTDTWINLINSTCQEQIDNKLSDDAGTATTTMGGGQEETTGYSIGGISFDDLSTISKIYAAIEALNNLMQGGSLYESVMLAAAAGFVDSDQIYKLAAVAALIDDNPELAASLAVADALGYEDLLSGVSSSTFNQAGTSTSIPWNYIQNRTAEMAVDLYKISALQGIASSIGELIANFMGEEQGDAFLETWDGTVDSLADLASGLLTYEYADVATYGGYSGYTNGYSGLSSYLTGGTSVAGTSYYYNPQGASTTQYSSDLSSLIASQISATVTGSTEKNTTNIVLTGYTQPLINQLINLGSIIVPTSNGVYTAEIGSLILSGTTTSDTTDDTTESESDIETESSETTTSSE